MKQKRTTVIAVLLGVGVVVLGALLATRRTIPLEVGGPEPTPGPVAPGLGGAPKVDIGTSQQALEQARQTIILAAVSGGRGSGTATRSFDGKKLLVTVSASLEDPPLGQYYEGWLVSGAEVISLGRLDPFEEQYALVYSSSAARLLGADRVLVTQETVDDDRPETTILEGRFE